MTYLLNLPRYDEIRKTLKILYFAKPPYTEQNRHFLALFMQKNFLETPEDRAQLRIDLDPLRNDPNDYNGHFKRLLSFVEPQVNPTWGI